MAPPPLTTSTPIRIGISACLLGVRVRFDAGHKRDAYINELLGQFLTFVPVCPEVEVGMSTPRESLRLVGSAETPRLLTVRTKADWTARMEHYARTRVAAIKAVDLDGFILKSKSPSCGMERVKIYTDNGMPNHAGVGLFARELQRQCPALPVEEEGRLNDAALRENFIVRVFTHARWRELRAQRFATARLVAFHAQHKLLLMAHSETHMRQLGRLVAAIRQRPATQVLADYETGLFDALRNPATRKRHTNVLHHAAGYFREGIPDSARQELAQVIDRYRRGLLPLIVPITLIRHHLLLCPQPYLTQQIYFDPHPQELMLLNHV